MKNSNIENEVHQLTMSIKEMKVQMDYIINSLRSIEREFERYIIPKEQVIDSMHKDVKELVMAQHVRDALERNTILINQYKEKSLSFRSDDNLKEDGGKNI